MSQQRLPGGTEDRQDMEVCACVCVCGGGGGEMVLSALPPPDLMQRGQGGQRDLGDQWNLRGPSV